MSKQCSHPGCNNPVFSKGLCSWHAPKKAIPRNGRSGSTQPLKRYSTIKTKRKPTGELTLFIEIAEERPLVSFLSGKSLTIYRDPDTKEYDKEQFVKMFAHVLPKNKFPHYRLFKKNIVLLTPYEHFLLDQGTEKQRQDYADKHNCDWSIIYTLTEELRNKYPLLF